MDKCKIFKIIQFSTLSLFVTVEKVWAKETNSQEENVDSDEESEEEDDDDEEASDFEPMKELPDAQQICPNLDRALALSINKYKIRETKIYDPIFKNFKFGLEISSLCKDLWYIISQRKSKDRDYNFDFHGRIGMVWKHNLYIGGDCGYSTGKDCIWEGDDGVKDDKKLDTKFAHLSHGLYLNAMVGYDYVFDKNNDVILAAKFGYSLTTIEKLKDQTCSSGDKTEFRPYWVGLLVAVENKLWASPMFWGFDMQVNYLINKKDIEGLENYLIPDFGHSEKNLNFGFNIFLGLKFNLEEEVIVP